MNKKSINIISIILVGIGIISASLIYHDRTTSDIPLLKIDDEDAKRLALSEGNWNNNTLKDKSVNSNLLHIKNDGFTFLVDPDSFKDKELYMAKFSDLEPEQYVWHVIVQNENNREWNYVIDANNGNIILSSEQTIEKLQPANPYDSVDEKSIIAQAKGDVIVTFPEGITEDKSNPFVAKLVVTVGDTVTWKNNDIQAHSVADVSDKNPSSTGKVFDSGLIDSDKSFSFTFAQKHIGQIDYACLIHPWEMGSITVQEKMG